MHIDTLVFELIYCGIELPGGSSCLSVWMDPMVWCQLQTMSAG
uniref:Uncharacterized protein n=1 Tax=Anguilla anguilla TaxID=7936 RepID=A0A0E9R8E5_ANGAN